MTRAVPEWVGNSDDHVPPQRVRLRVFERCKGLCHACNRKIGPGDRWTLEHLTALILGGENRESNLGLTCEWCLPGKNAEDQAAKSKLAKISKRHRSIKPPSRFRQAPTGMKFNWSKGRYEKVAT